MLWICYFFFTLGFCIIVLLPKRLEEAPGLCSLSFSALHGCGFCIVIWFSLVSLAIAYY